MSEQIGSIEISAERKAFCEAFSKAQGAIEGAVKNSTNPHFRAKYSDLGAVWDAIREHFSSNGLSVMQFPDFDPEASVVVMRTTIMHAAGFEKSFITRLPVSKCDAHGVGSGFTYARRYSLAAAAGVAPEDDDGNAAAQPTGKGTGYKADGRMTASKAKGDGKGSWPAFRAKLATFTDPDECNEWFNRQATQDLINSWPKGDAGDWAELAADEYDKHIQTLYGTKADLKNGG